MKSIILFLLSISILYRMAQGILKFFSDRREKKKQEFYDYAGLVIQVFFLIIALYMLSIYLLKILY